MNIHARRLAPVAALLLAAGFLTSCATTTSLLKPANHPEITVEPGYYIYSGTRAVFINESIGYSHMPPLALIDVPLSFAADTILLPATVPVELVRLMAR